MTTPHDSDGPATERGEDYPRPGLLELLIAVGLIIAGLAGW